MKVYIDRIEGGMAVMVLVDDDTISFNLPLNYLPAGSQAGDYFNVTFSQDSSSRQSTSESVGRLLEELTSDPEQTDFQL